MAARFTEDEVLAATGAGRRSPVGAGVHFEVCTDTRKLTPGCLFVALKGERFDAHDFLHKAVEGGARGLLVEEGHPSLPAGFVVEGVGVYTVKDTLQGLGALARFHRRRFGPEVPVGAVGGSNGKTTTKEMVAAILETRGPALRTQGNFNNEVGLPLTLFGFSEEHVAAVLELGLNHAGEMDRLARIAEPHAAVLTVIQPEHLEGLGSIEGVAKAEAELFHALSPGATAVVNLDEPLIAREAAALKCRVLTFGRAEDAEVRLVSVEKRGREGLLARVQDGRGGKVWEVPLAFLGEHNALNATAAFALARALGYPAEACVKGLGRAKPYARRLNLVDAPGGVTVLDDCYNANTQSVIAALDTARDLAASQGGRAVAVLGDMLELGPGELDEHRTVGAHAASSVALLALFGPRSAATREAAGKGAHFEDVGALVAWLRPQLREGDVVLVKGSRGMRLERVVEALASTKTAGGGAP